MQKYLRSTSGFTLVEMVIAMTIFAVMSAAIVSIYLQSTAMSYRLKASRYLSETAREITERIADDVREYGYSGVTETTTYPYWNGTYNYTGSGSEILGIGDGTRKYLYGKKSSSGIDPCIDSVVGNYKTDPKIHCGLYMVSGTDYINAHNLVDTFIPDDAKKRVKIIDLKFYTSGDGDKTEHKVTLVFTLMLMPRIGVPLSTAESQFHVQTTITARSFKKN